MKHELVIHFVAFINGTSTLMVNYGMGDHQRCDFVVEIVISIAKYGK